MKWFRYYPETLIEAKVQLLPPEVFKTWVNLLCLATQRGKGGKLPPVHSIAFALRLTEEEATAHCAALDRANLLDIDAGEGVYVIADWDRYENPEADRQTPEYRKWREAVLLRDGFTCQDCGATGEEVPVQAHHKSEYAKDRAGRFDPENGITLCVDCHRAEHSRRATR